MFSEQVAIAMEHYSRMGVKGLEDCAATVAFIRRVNKLIEAMNANSPSQSLRPKDPLDVTEEEDEPSASSGSTEINSNNYGPQSTKPKREVWKKLM